MSLPEMSFSGVVLIFVIIVLRTLFMNRLPKKTFLFLWGIVLIRLLVPVSVESITSIYSLMQSNNSVTNSVMDTVRQAEITNSFPVDGNVPDALNEVPESVVPGMETISIWSVIWLLGAVLCVGFFVASYIKCYQKFRFSMPVNNEFSKLWIGQHPLKRRLSIRQTEVITAPISYGMIRPVILMPKDTEWKNVHQLRYVLEHEYVHIQRFDILTKLVLIVAVCIHWFNPFVWIMYVLFNRDMELSCDETVVCRFGIDLKSSYAETLISMEEKKSSFTPLCNGFSKNAIEERIRAIMKTRKISIISGTLAVILVIGTASVFATSAITADKKDFLAGSNQEESGTVESMRSKGQDGTDEAYPAYQSEWVPEYEKSVYQSEWFPEYQKYGLSYDEKSGHLLYDNQIVGYFKDEMEPNLFTRFRTEGGTAAITVMRDEEWKITGFSVGEVEVSDDISNQGVAEEVTGTAADNTVIGNLLTDNSYENNDPVIGIPQKYTDLGISVDERNNWVYDGKIIADLYDPGNEIYANENGSICLIIQRDQDNKIKSVEEVSKAEIQELLDSTFFGGH